jgi:hypothetical protein
MGQLDRAAADGGHVTSRGERLALGPPDHGPHVRPLLQLGEDVEEP